MKKLLQLTSLALLATCAFAGTVSPDFQVTNPLAPVKVIIQLNTPPTPVNLSVMQSGGATITRQYRHFPMLVELTLPAGLVKPIAALPFVKYVTPVRTVTRHLDLTAATVGSTLAFQAGLTGQGIGVAVIDSGIDSSNADLSGRVVYSQDFTGEGVTRDLYGHGTHVAGIVGGSGANSNGRYRGIAPGVNLVNLRVLDETGSGQDDAIISAIDTAIELAPVYNIRVIICLWAGRSMRASLSIRSARPW